MKFFFNFSIIFFWTVNSFAVCVSSKTANLYRQPSVKSEIFRKVAKYTPLKWTGIKKLGFLQIMDKEGIKSWIRPSQISPKMICLQVKTKKVHLREGPGYDFEKSNWIVDQGDTFLDLGGEDGWTMVQDVNGRKAWINLDHIWKPVQLSRISFDSD